MPRRTSLELACAMPLLLRGACAHPPLLYADQLRQLPASPGAARLQALAEWEQREPLPPRRVRPRDESASAAWWEAELELEDEQATAHDPR